MRSITFILVLFVHTRLYAQVTDPQAVVAAASDSASYYGPKDNWQDKDIRDLIRKMSKRKDVFELYTAREKDFEFTLLPAAGYTLQTGFAVLLAANAVFYADKKDHSRASTILGNIAYTQYNQLIVPVSVNLSTRNRKYNIISDIRYMKYPSQTFGLGPHTRPADGYTIDYSYLKLHQTILRRVGKNIFAGGGYYLDHFWNQREKNPPVSVTSFESYGLHSYEVASGICFQILWDTRSNQINPLHGWYASARYRLNSKLLGSSENWHSEIVEMRKYFHLPGRRNNTIAFWNYNWLTFGGRPPYLLLPSTGWDDFFNIGRGYIQGRFRDTSMSYIESEYRFGVTRNGLLGAVVFANAQTYSNSNSKLYRTVIPGGGFGLRVKVNKHSSTNLAIDYGFGMNGSRGFFINLGEVF